MARIKYSVEVAPETTSKAMGYELRVSPKHAREIANTIKGMKTADAKKFLEDVITLKKAVPFKRYKREVGHRRGLKGWDAGRFPQKAASAILEIIKNAEANAEYKGLESERMKIKHISTKTGMVRRSIFPRAYGRATPKRRESVTVEIVLEEL